MIRMFATLVACAVLAAASDGDAAVVDRNRFPAADHGYLYYFTTSTVPENRQSNLAHTLKYVVSSLSRDQNLDSHLPKQVGPTLFRIDTRELKWETTLANVLIAHYPYAKHLTSQKIAPLCIRADWFCSAIVDETLTKESQYLLLFGKDVKNSADFLKFFKAGSEASDTFGYFEGKSGVRPKSAGLERVMHTVPVGRGALYQTFDSAIVAGETDGLENVDSRPPKHDASELIAPLIKVGKDEAGETKAGVLFAWFLANGNRAGVAGQRQAFAPNNIVEDSLNLRGYDIRNNLDCVSCHSQGLKLPTLDRYREAIVGGVIIKSYDAKLALDIERYYQSAFVRDVKRGMEDFTVAMKLVNGLTPDQNRDLFCENINAYDDDVTPQQAALELGTTDKELSLAIAYYVEKYKDRNTRIAMLAERQSISRAQFELNAYKLQEIMRLWAKH